MITATHHLEDVLCSICLLGPLPRTLSWMRQSYLMLPSLHPEVYKSIIMHMTDWLYYWYINITAIWLAIKTLRQASNSMKLLIYVYHSIVLYSIIMATMFAGESEQKLKPTLDKEKVELLYGRWALSNIANTCESHPSYNAHAQLQYSTKLSMCYSPCYIIQKKSRGCVYNYWL